MRIYSRKNPVKFHPDPFWNDRALGIFVEVTQQEEEDDDDDDK